MHSLAHKGKSVEIQILIQFYLLAWDKNDHFEQQWYLVSHFNHLFLSLPGLKITAGQRTMSGLIEALTGQTFDLPVMLTGQN